MAHMDVNKAITNCKIKSYLEVLPLLESLVVGPPNSKVLFSTESLATAMHRIASTGASDAHVIGEVQSDRRFQALVQEVEHRLMGVPHQFNNQSLANVIWGAGKLRLSQRPVLFQAAEREVLTNPKRVLSSFTPQQLAAIAWGFIAAEMSAPKLFHAIQDEAHLQPTLDDLLKKAGLLQHLQQRNVQQNLAVGSQQHHGLGGAQYAWHRMQDGNNGGLASAAPTARAPPGNNGFGVPGGHVSSGGGAPPKFHIPDRFRIPDEEVMQVTTEVDDLDLGLTRKKKKDKDVEEDGEEGKAKATSGSFAAPTDLGPNDIYQYEQILERIYDALFEKNPQLMGRKKFTLIPPQVAREGSRKTVFVNFKEVCKRMHCTMKRWYETMEHVMWYFNAELAVECSLDPEGRLTFKGRFTPKQIESVVKKYMLTYVQCKMCKNFDTNLVKDPTTRLTFIECNLCKARKSVQAVQKGFHATNSMLRKYCPNGHLLMAREGAQSFRNPDNNPNYTYQCYVCLGPRIKLADAWMISVCCPECDYDVCYECHDIKDGEDTDD